MMPDRYWCESSHNDIEEMLETSQQFFFRYNGNDYMIERFANTGYIIVDPDPFYANGGWADKADFAYYGHGLTNTPEEFLALPFLDGKTLYECWNELRFFNY
jgi:hypothetical protein